MGELLYKYVNRAEMDWLHFLIYIIHNSILISIVEWREVIMERKEINHYKIIDIMKASCIL